MPIPLTCPHCRRALETLDEHAGRQVRCPGCSGVVDVPSASVPAAPEVALVAPVGAPPMPPATAASPWANREQFGWVRGFALAWSQVVFHPEAYFRDLPRSGGLGRAFLFGLVCVYLGSAGRAVWTRVYAGDPVARFQEELSELQQALPQMGSGSGPKIPPEYLSAYKTVSSPLIVLPALLVLAAMDLLFWAVLTHLGAMMVGGRGFEHTLRVVSYAWAPMALMALPLPPSGLWVWPASLALWIACGYSTYHGAVQTWRMTPGRAAVVAVFPFVAYPVLMVGFLLGGLCCFGIFLAGAMG